MHARPIAIKSQTTQWEPATQCYVAVQEYTNQFADQIMRPTAMNVWQSAGVLPSRMVPVPLPQLHPERHRGPLAYAQGIMTLSADRMVKLMEILVMLGATTCHMYQGSVLRTVFVYKYGNQFVAVIRRLMLILAKHDASVSWLYHKENVLQCVLARGI
mgnify:CR=1 FL=1